MRHFMRLVAPIAFVCLLPVRSSSQAPTAPAEGFVPVPSNVKAEGLPPIPASIPAALAPYGRFRRAQMVAWAPAGRQILVQTAAGAVEQVHAVTAPGAPPVQLTTSKDTVTGGASYEPTSGAYFVYRVPGPQELAQLYRFDVATKTTTQLTNPKGRNGVPVWSHRSRRIAFESTERNGTDRDLYVMDPENPAGVRRVAELTGQWTVSGWSADDLDLLAIELKSGAETCLWRVNVETGAKTPLSPPGDRGVWSWAQFTPDGHGLFAVSDRQSELTRVWYADLKSGAWKPVTRAGDSVEASVLSPDGSTLAVVFDRDASSRLELIDAKSFAVRARPAIPVGQMLKPPIWNARSTDVAITLGSVGTFGDVFSVNRKGAVERWTTSESGAIANAALPDAEIIHWKSFDGRMISGVLYRPPAKFTGPRPVIINIHGGPNGPMARERPRFQGRSAYFLNELGIAIVYPNVRGSYGFGRTFESLDDGAHREDAVKDIGALLDWIAAQRFLDKSRVLVTGASYGGYMTYAVAETYGDRIRCAYAASGISNFISYFETTDPARLGDRRAEYGDEREPSMREFLTRISPVTQTSKLRGPLLIAHGRQDSRVPVGQAEEMYRAGKANGAPVWLVVFDDEGHENFPVRAPNSNFHFYTWILFAQKYLLN